MTDSTPYFAYGSNINQEQMARRAPNATPVCAVTLSGYELAFRGEAGRAGVATIIPKQGSTVHGLLWRITQECEQALDRYEGFPMLYGKHTVVVKDKDGVSLRAMAYIMTPEFSRDAAYPSSAYLNGIRQGYQANGLPLPALRDSVLRTRHEIEQTKEPPFRQYFNQLKKGKPPRPHGRGR